MEVEAERDAVRPLLTAMRTFMGDRCSEKLVRINRPRFSSDAYVEFAVSGPTCLGMHCLEKLVMAFPGRVRNASVAFGPEGMPWVHVQVPVSESTVFPPHIPLRPAGLAGPQRFGSISECKEDSVLIHEVFSCVYGMRDPMEVVDCSVLHSPGSHYELEVSGLDSVGYDFMEHLFHLYHPRVYDATFSIPKTMTLFLSTSSGTSANPTMPLTLRNPDTRNRVTRKRAVCHV